MNNQEIVFGLIQLGFDTGWVITEGKITLWENSEPEPTTKEISDASKLWHKAQIAEAEAKQTAREAIADRLGLTADELQVLLG